MLKMTIALGINREHHAEYRELMAGYLHFIHGRNPLSLCYLSNMTRRRRELRDRDLSPVVPRRLAAL